MLLGYVCLLMRIVDCILLMEPVPNVMMGMRCLMALVLSVSPKILIVKLCRRIIVRSVMKVTTTVLIINSVWSLIHYAVSRTPKREIAQRAGAATISSMVSALSSTNSPLSTVNPRRWWTTSGSARPAQMGTL
jgi:hypothetical protein